MPPKKTVPRKKVAKTKPVARKNAKQTKPKPKPKPTIKKFKRGGGEIGEKLEVTIGKFIFHLVASYKYTEYDVVHIASREINDKQQVAVRFSVYRSGSCTFWRFVQSFANIRFDKGSDYVQASFIHLNLQKFIDENFANITKQETVIKNISDIPDARIASFDKYDILNNGEREVQYDCFIPMSTLESGYCLTKDFIDNASGFVKSIKDKDMFDKMITKVGELETSKIETQTETKPSPNICKLIDLVNYYMFEMFIDNKNEEKLYNKYVQFPGTVIQCDKASAINYRCITCKHTNDEFMVHYMELPCTTKKGNRVTGRNIFLVLPKSDIGNNITMFGLYAKYVKVGMYASKALEYCDQSTICSGAKCSKIYTALFNFMNLWPFDKDTSYSMNCKKASGQK
jgi:hypothetical protein